MLFKIEKIGGKIDKSLLDKTLESLENGSFLLSIKKVSNFKTSRECQEQYFVMVDACVAHSGYGRYEIHEMFKEHQLNSRGLGSTRDLSFEQWQQWLQDFKWYAFENFDCLV